MVLGFEILKLKLFEAMFRKNSSKESLSGVLREGLISDVGRDLKECTCADLMFDSAGKIVLSLRGVATAALKPFSSRSGQGPVKSLPTGFGCRLSATKKKLSPKVLKLWSTKGERARE